MALPHRRTVAAILFFIVLMQSSVLLTQQATGNQSSRLSENKWKLWSKGTKLRGANIWQRKVVPDLDYDFLGEGYIGPPYTQEDFNKLSKLGANYVNLSVPGIFTEKPPYVLDTRALSNLEDLLDKAEKADLFVVITYRTGPGRSDFTFYRDGAGVWFKKELLIESVWQSKEAQDAWAAMWRFTAERFKNRKHIAGYDLMCEPNAEDVCFGIYDPSSFYPEYTGTIYDWNQFYPKLVKAIRMEDSGTPILVSCSGWGNPSWLPYLRLVSEQHVLVSFHQYEPHGYTHQDPGANIVYPGKFDTNEDGRVEQFDKTWLETLFADIVSFGAASRIPLACNEYGLRRFAPGADNFLEDELALMEKHGINHAIWMWYPDWQAWKNNAAMNDFNFRMLPKADSVKEADNALISILKKYWAKNTVRPSSW